MTTPGARLSLRLTSFGAAGLLLTLGCADQPTAPTASAYSESAVSLAAGAPLDFRQLSAGTGHACGVATDGRAYCWGDSRFGQLGNGTVREGPELCEPSAQPELTCSTRPVAVVGGLRFLQVSAGLWHTCGITTEHVMYCWGQNKEGQAGNGYVDNIGTPTQMVTDLRFREVSAGDDHTCAITVSDLAYCWGANDEGQLGHGGGPAARPNPTLVGGGYHWLRLSAGDVHTCGVTGRNRAYCWGNNRNGALGDGSTTNRTVPVAVASGMLFLQITAGTNHSCAINIGYRAFCWGTNNEGQLGDGTRIHRLTPTAVAGTRVFNRVSANLGFTCAVTRTGQGVCWGRGLEGQLGNGTTFRRALPTPVSGGLVFADVNGGLAYSCAVTTAGRGYCWGNNFWGNLGDGTQQTRLTPTAMVGPAS
jgi:alpha-tubulin suppressor-like RCC1 family protein